MPDFKFTEKAIREAAEKAIPGSRKYLAIMDAFMSVDVSQDIEFQRTFNGFYGITPWRDSDWQSAYYKLLQTCKGNPVSFRDSILNLQNATGCFEASFASKLVATVDPFRPVWDKYVLKNVGLRAPNAKSPDRTEEAVRVYDSLQNWYLRFLKSDSGKNLIGIFNTVHDEYYRFTDQKKADLVLWQLRGDNSIDAVA